MKISLLTDAPDYNLALMKLSAFHKAQGDEVILNNPIQPANYTYASVLFEWNKGLFYANEYGGPQFPEFTLSPEVERMRPDYDIYPIDFSLGYTFRPCFRGCLFCKVRLIKQPDVVHHSIWEFHDKRFKKICLMNNNTFFDRLWKETFEEIWAENLELTEHGFDVRLVDDEKAEAIKKTKFASRPHFAWDRMKDEKIILERTKILKDHKIGGRFYVMCGYDTNLEQDIYRCQQLINLDQVPFVMPFNKSDTVMMHFMNFINSLDWWHGRENIKPQFDKYIKGEMNKKQRKIDKKLTTKTEEMF